MRTPLSFVIGVMLCIVALLFLPAISHAQCDAGCGQSFLVYDIPAASQAACQSRTRPVFNAFATARSRLVQRAKGIRTRLRNRSRRGC